MALFGKKRDISLFRHINRELMGDIISQQCIHYKLKSKETKTNIYGEASGNKFYYNPVILTCLIERQGQEFTEDEFGVQFSRRIDFRFLKDDLLNKSEPINADYDKGNYFGANVVPEVGDILGFNGGYYEIENVITNQLTLGKDPKYPNNTNPINPGLEDYGWDLSVICKTHYVPKDTTGIEKARING